MCDITNERKYCRRLLERNLNKPLVMTEKSYRIIRELLNARFVKNSVIKKMST